MHIPCCAPRACRLERAWWLTVDLKPSTKRPSTRQQRWVVPLTWLNQRLWPLTFMASGIVGGGTWRHKTPRLNHAHELSRHLLDAHFMLHWGASVVHSSRRAKPSRAQTGVVPWCLQCSGKRPVLVLRYEWQRNGTAEPISSPCSRAFVTYVHERIADPVPVSAGLESVCSIWVFTCHKKP